MKNYLFAAAVILLAALGGWYWLGHSPAPVAHTPKVVHTDYKNTTYIIDGQPVTLVNGQAETPAAPGSAEKIITQVFGNEATGDLSGDGLSDTALILMQSTGGSGTFFYAVVALATTSGAIGTNAILLGDRIAPQATQVEYGEAVFNYADRAAGEPMSAQPSTGVSKYLYVTHGTLAEIPANMYAGGNLLLGTDASKKLGTYLIGSSGKTIYMITKGLPQISDCVEQCALNWPPYLVATTSALANVQAGIPGAVGSALRADGSLQVTYKGNPLYFFKNDVNSGDTLGQGVGNMWAVVAP